MKEKDFVFDSRYVLSVTFQHILRAIDISVSKTIQNFDKVKEGTEGADMLRTLSFLNKLKKSHVTFMESNPEMFKK